MPDRERKPGARAGRNERCIQKRNVDPNETRASWMLLVDKSMTDRAVASMTALRSWSKYWVAASFMAPPDDRLRRVSLVLVYEMVERAMNVWAYVRVFTAEQANNGESLDTQRRQADGYAMMKGWQVAGVFVERGVSGSVPLADRPEGARLLAAVEPGDAVVTPKLDRMFRSASDALGTLEELKTQGVGLHMIDLGGDVCGNGISKLVFTILSAVAENERDRIRERIRDVKRNLAAQGIYNGGRRPIGSDVVDGKLVPNEEEQALLKRVREMKVAGAKIREIARAVGKQPMTIKRLIDRRASQAFL